MKAHTKLIASAIVVFGILKVGTFDAAWAIESSPPAQAQPTAPVQRTASDYLSVQDDGTLLLNSAGLASIPEGQRSQATESLNTLNEDIRKGKTQAFSVDDARLKLPIGDNGAQQMGNCFCGDHCCSQHMCCSSGFWLLCWGYGSC